VAVLGIGLAAALLIGYTLAPFQFRVSHDELQNLPARFDAGWYLTIARRGYQWRAELRGHQQSIAFFPLFPMAMRIAGDIVTIPARLLRDPLMIGGGDARMLWGGVLCSIACFGLALPKVYERGVIDLGDAAGAGRSVLLLATYPFAVFFSAPYSEALFLLASVATTLAWSKGELRRALWWGLAAGLARSNGWTLSVPLLLDAAFGAGRRDQTRIRLLVAMGPVLGASVFSLYVYGLTGNPVDWIHAQQGWGRALTPLAFVTRRGASIGELGFLGYIAGDPVDAITGVCVLLTLGTSLALIWRRDWLNGMLGLCYLAPALLIDLPAAGRMTAVVFPTFVALARLLRGAPYVGVVVAFALVQAYLAARFFLWRPPF
jgi:hypothetical protein